MNMLSVPAPRCVDIGGESFAIRWSFRTGIRFERLLLDERVPEARKAALAYRLFYPEYPRDVRAGLEKILWFWGCGKMPQRTAKQKNTAPVFDYDWDAGLIYAAFMADYGMDLESVEGLHWWKFRALFTALRSENLLCRVMEARGADLTKMQGEQKAYYRKMKALYALPKPARSARCEEQIVAALSGDGNVARVLEDMVQAGEGTHLKGG